MDEFSLDRNEFSGTLISLEFGSGGRIQQLWAMDPALSEQTDEFQFVLGPLNFGEEFAEDYHPGTILLGARTDPEEPWILSRNRDAEAIEDPEDPGAVSFRYDFPLLPEIDATGRFFELPGPIPQLVWEVALRNTGRIPIEIGELGFPFALNNLYEGFPRTDSGLKEMWADRLYLHKFVGGAASYLFAQRLNARPPGLLVFPGEGTKWEFYNHVPASLATGYRWEGIPVMYVHSRAIMEREEWGSWFNDHTAVVIDPGDAARYQTRFVPADRERADNVHPTLALCGHPAIKLFPGAVAPKDVGVAIEVMGATPTDFAADTETSLETDSDEQGGFAFVRPAQAGPLRLAFADSKGRISMAHLLFTEPIDELIRRRADWIVANQLHDEPGSAFHRAFVCTDIRGGLHMTDHEDYESSFGARSSVADALYLAEKNSIYPDAGQIRAIDAYIAEFLRDDLQNPGDRMVGSSFADPGAVATNYARAAMYPLVAGLYHAMHRVAAHYGGTAWDAETYLREAGRTAVAMFDGALGRDPRIVGVPAASHLGAVVEDLREAGLREEAEELHRRIVDRAHVLLRRRYPYAGDSLWTTGGYEEVFSAALLLRHEEQLERSFRCAFAARSLAPSWWWYGSDKRFFEDREGAPHPAVIDRGEMCLGPTTPANAMMFFQLLDRDYAHLPEASMRLAFGGLLGVWALVRGDGAASMGFCPDPASRQYGISPVTGDVGLSLFHYLRGVGAYVLPSRASGTAAFGCHFQADDGGYVVRPWDGVGRKVVVRQIGLEARAAFGKMSELRFDARKRHLTMRLENPSDKDLECPIELRGMWGRAFDVGGREAKADDGVLRARVPVKAGAVESVEIKVTA